MLASFWFLLSMFLISGDKFVESQQYVNWEMKAGEKQSMLSKDYPANAPSNYNHVWTARPPLNGDLKITCHDLTIPGEEPCDDYSFRYMDYANDGYLKKVCGGDKSGYTFRTTSVGLYAILETGPGESQSRLNCTIEAIGSTTEHPWSFLEMEIEDRDSSEHGGPEGRLSPTCPCGWANKNQARIINGAETKVNEYPFIGLLTHDNSVGGFCGASLITEYHALTAAHCISPNGPKIVVAFGEHDVRTNTETKATIRVGVKDWIIYPEYKQYEHDIAILILETKVTYTREIGPICLPTKPVGNLKGEYAKVLGWGYDSKYSEGTPVLQKADVRFLSKDNCHNIWNPWVPKGSKNMWCVFARNQRACYGDSGGPIVWLDPDTNRYTQLGINAFVRQGCDANWPVVITDVSAYIDWIKKVTKETAPNGRICSKHPE